MSKGFLSEGIQFTVIVKQRKAAVNIVKHVNIRLNRPLNYCTLSATH